MTTEKQGPVLLIVKGQNGVPFTFTMMGPNRVKGVFCPITPDGSVGGRTQEMANAFKEELEDQDTVPGATYSTPFGWELHTAIQAILDQVKEPTV